MKKTILAILCVTALLTNGLAQKTINDPNAQVRDVKDFHGISVSHAFDVYLTQGNEEKVAVSASEAKYLEFVTVEVKNGILHIGWDNKGKKWQNGNKKLKAYVSYKKIDELRASGACDVNIVGSLSADDLNVKLSGASDVKGQITAKKLTVDMSGSSDMKVSGESASLKIDLSGASSFKGFDFVTATCDIDASGASDVKITVNKELSVELSGASDVSYKGSATIRDIRTSGASSVKRAS